MSAPKNLLATAVRVSPPDFDLSESPVWDDAAKCWIFVNINARKAFEFMPGKNEFVLLAEVSGDPWQHLCAVIPRKQGGFVAIGTNGIQVMTDNGSLVDGTYLELQSDLRIRFNDVQCLDGRIFGGTIDCEKFEQPIAAFGEITPDGFNVIQSGHVISNGLGVSKDGTKLFHVESREPWMYLYDRNPTTGELSNRRRAFQIIEGRPFPEALGDGLAMAIYNGAPVICLAEWGLSRIAIYDFNGNLVGQIDVPVTRPTSLSFGGNGFNQILITSERLPDDPADNCGLFHATVPGLYGFAPSPVNWP